ncbi:Protein CDV3 like [Pseudolycoriella hygida]|uniref:Protein CDV3 like n=1 Tax=Pseudolycoriella hygida TaxID=35572 RepID=A0A9Q0N451_9DIPT|nr:Protein CDV3 like [Pseudolycoriella hygida]
MADLDDFFAKKDRKKGKSKKITATEELARKIEDTSKPSQSLKKRDYLPGQDDNGSVPDDTKPSSVNEDEWKDYQEEERKDYTGLKLGLLQINDDDQLDGDAEGGEYGSDGEVNLDAQDKMKSGPWKKVEEDIVKPVKKEPVQEKAPVSSVYVSPALRNAQMLKATKLKKGILPDINNKEFFPVLGSAKPEEVKKKRPEPGFEEVKHGGRMQRSSDLQANAPVSIGNRFGSLADS